ncbi:nucleic acid/nucleotide deaminase domain-containing protein [Streptomyces sp. NPDC002992]|uniref:WXG100-like domain-containing protein n=1 Tax=Streptomyces sp. NPDC002992 TaxID=3154273 RepID=UPI0033A99E1D
MGMTLPDDLVEVLDLVGVDWPQIDEDEVKASAKDYRKLAEGIRDAVKEGNNACSHIVAGKSKGETVTAIDRRWGKLTTRDLATFAKGCDDLAGALDDCADLIVGCKVAIIAKLTATAAAATAGVVGMFFTVGLSGLLSAAAIGAARLLIQEAIDYAIDQITSIVTDKIEGKILTEIDKLFSDKLGGGATHDVMASGSTDMAQDLVIEFAEFEQAAGDYQKTATNFDKKKGEFKDGGAGRKSSVKKDSRFHKLATVMDKAEDAVDKKADEMVKTLEDHGGKIDKSKGSHKDHDDDVKEKLKKCDKDHDDDEVRTYLLSTDGTVERLLPNGTTKPLDSVDNARLDGILDNGKAWRPTSRRDQDDTKVPNTHPKRVVSTKISDLDSDPLVQATQQARYHRNDYTGSNYAAGRYIDPDGRGESILVGHSENPKGFHSERSIGYPILHNNKQSGLTEVFTEREPCQKSPSCDRWLDLHFPGTEVRHANDYNQSVPRHLRDKEHQDYMDDLKTAHGR